jgi:phosphoglycolate phosphatase
MQKNPLANIKLFLFDLDGTLIDTAPDFLTSLNNVLAENNRDLVHLDDIRQFISDGSGKLVEVGFGIDNDHEQFQQLKSALLREYKKNLTSLSKLFDGVKDLIDYLNDKNIVYGIVTNKPLEYAEPIIEFFDELKDCKILICPDHLRKAKPDPEGINLACDKLDINPNFACYVGDHDVDIAAGLAANVPVFACEYGYGSFEKESQSNEIRIMHPSEIIQFIEKINE